MPRRADTPWCIRVVVGVPCGRLRRVGGGIRKTGATISAEPIRVLVVDDHRMFTQSVIRLLADQAGIEVGEGVGSVAEAVEEARRFRPDVVVMDHRLPDGDGVTAAGLVLRDRPETRVLLVTGDRDERLLVRAIEAGCAGFVTKDRAVDELVEAIRVVAHGDAWVPPELVTRLLSRVHRTSQGLGSDLTPRELEVLRLAARGLANAAIANELHLSVNTVRNHVQNAITKLQAHSKLEAVAVAVREGIISFPS
jgi:DNA-binding NarL/FixJ family response regulator